jgi:hypothetical protein
MRDVDIWDTQLLFRRCHLAGVDVKYWCGQLGSDWGLFTTIMDNFARPEFCELADVKQLKAWAMDAPKSVGWQARALVGRSMRWWQPVYEA